VTGRVLLRNGSPATSAQIELWQANAAGRYIHPLDRSDAPLDPNFQGYARLRAGADGGFRLISVKPGAYPLAGMLRTPHIHFIVASGGRQLTTQMYFAAESGNARDSLLGTMADRGEDPRLLVARPLPTAASGAKRFEWTVVF
jgi:protocatechuate 3,4-dioxygenase, beta subunit